MWTVGGCDDERDSMLQMWIKHMWEAMLWRPWVRPFGSHGRRASTPGVSICAHVCRAFIQACLQLWCYMKSRSVFNTLCISTENIRNIFVLYLAFFCLFLDILIFLSCLDNLKIWMRCNFLLWLIIGLLFSIIILFWYSFSSVSSVQSLSCVRLFATPWIAARQASLSITNSWSLLKLVSIELMMPSNHFILRRPLLLLPPIPPSIRVFSNESTLCMRWPKYWSFSFSISPSNEHPGLVLVSGILIRQMGLSKIFWLPPHHSQGEGSMQMIGIGQLEWIKEFIFKEVNIAFKTMNNCKIFYLGYPSHGFPLTTWC